MEAPNPLATVTIEPCCGAEKGGLHGLAASINQRKVTSPNSERTQANAVSRVQVGRGAVQVPAAVHSTTSAPTKEKPPEHEYRAWSPATPHRVSRGQVTGSRRRRTRVARCGVDRSVERRRQRRAGVGRTGAERRRPGPRGQAADSVRAREGVPRAALGADGSEGRALRGVERAVRRGRQRRALVGHARRGGGRPRASGQAGRTESC